MNIGRRDCSEVLTQLSKSHQSAHAAGIAEQMNAVSAPLLEQIERSMAIDAVGPAPRCFPYVAGIRECGMLPKAASNRDSGTQCSTCGMSSRSLMCQSHGGLTQRLCTVVQFSHQITSSSVQKCAVRCLSYMHVPATCVFLLRACSCYVLVPAMCVFLL